MTLGQRGAGRVSRTSRGRGVSAASCAATSTATCAGAVGYPHIAHAINEDAVRREHQAAAKMRDEVALGIELEHGIE
jgi:hypothetical protein